MIPKEALEAFIDERLEAMRLRPGMYGGTPAGVEAQCWVLLDLFTKFLCPAEESRYQEFRQKVLPKCPGPMALAQWFTDKKYGDPQAIYQNDLDHWAGVKIVEFYTAFKKYLKT